MSIQHLFQDGIGALYGGNQAIFVPSALLKDLPISSLNLLVDRRQPDFKAAGFMDEHDRDFQFARFLILRQEGEIGHVHITEVDTAGYGKLGVAVGEMSTQGKDVFHQALVCLGDDALFHLEAILVNGFVEFIHIIFLHNSKDLILSARFQVLAHIHFEL